MTYTVVIVAALRSVLRALRGTGGESSSRTLLRNSQGEIVAIGGRERTAAGELSGRGRRMSVPLQLQAGSYRIDYQFAVNTRLALLDETGDDETLIMGMGAGNLRITIPTTGDYRMLIEPIRENAAWTVIYRPMH